MTDTGPPTDPGDIVVVGQRRSDPGYPFPERPEPPTGPVDPNTPTIEDDPGFADPCADPETALEWNADAAAADALKKFKAKAAELGDDGLYEREFGCQLYQSPDGSIYLGPITYGDPLTGTFNFDESGATVGNLVGEIHSHPTGQVEPSVADWGRLNVWSGWTQRNFRSYIVSRDLSDPSSDFAIRVYDTTSDQSSDDPGPEVNPESSPCP